MIERLIKHIEAKNELIQKECQLVQDFLDFLLKNQFTYVKFVEVYSSSLNIYTSIPTSNLTEISVNLDIMFVSIEEQNGTIVVSFDWEYIDEYNEYCYDLSQKWKEFFNKFHILKPHLKNIC